MHWIDSERTLSCIPRSFRMPSLTIRAHIIWSRCSQITSSKHPCQMKTKQNVDRMLGKQREPLPAQSLLQRRTSAPSISCLASQLLNLRRLAARSLHLLYPRMTYPNCCGLAVHRQHDCWPIVMGSINPKVPQPPKPPLSPDLKSSRHPNFPLLQSHNTFLLPHQCRATSPASPPSSPPTAQTPLAIDSRSPLHSS